MHCQECGKESQPGEVICSACSGALSDAELDLPEVAAFPVKMPSPPPMPAAPLTIGSAGIPAAGAPPAASSSGPAKGPRLEIAVGTLTGAVALKPGVTAIGRADAAAGIHADADLSMDPAVSRRHAEIRGSASGYVIVDLGSTNGTVVNGRVIARHQETPLADGDEIRLGESCRLTVRLT